MKKTILAALVIGLLAAGSALAGPGGYIPARETVTITNLEQLHEECKNERDLAVRGSRNVVVRGVVQWLPQNCFRERGSGNGPTDATEGRE